MARPTKYNQDRADDILDAAREGKTKEGCARAGGISYDTLRRWLDRGEDGEEPFAKFREAFDLARAEGESHLVERVADRKPEFILERSYGYTRTQRVEHDHGTGKRALEVVMWDPSVGEDAEDEDAD